MFAIIRIGGRRTNFQISAPAIALPAGFRWPLPGVVLKNPWAMTPARRAASIDGRVVAQRTCSKLAGREEPALDGGRRVVSLHANLCQVDREPGASRVHQHVDDGARQ